MSLIMVAPRPPTSRSATSEAIRRPASTASSLRVPRTATALVDSTTDGQLSQWSWGSGNLVLSNTGSSAEVGAVATVTGIPAAAVANATLVTAVDQHVGWGSTVTATFNNGDGSLLIDAVANAVGGTAATANAEIDNYGFGQFANPGFPGTGPRASSSSTTMSTATLRLRRLPMRRRLKAPPSPMRPSPRPRAGSAPALSSRPPEAPPPT